MTDNRQGGHSPGNRIQTAKLAISVAPVRCQLSPAQRDIGRRTTSTNTIPGQTICTRQQSRNKAQESPSHAHAHAFEDRVPFAPILHPALREDKRRAEQIGVSINAQRDSATPDWSGTAKLDLADRR